MNGLLELYIGNFIEKQNLLSKQEIKSLENNYLLDSNLIIDKNLYLASNKKLHIQKGVKKIYSKSVTVFSYKVKKINSLNCPDYYS